MKKSGTRFIAVIFILLLMIIAVSSGISHSSNPQQESSSFDFKSKLDFQNDPYLFPFERILSLDILDGVYDKPAREGGYDVQPTDDGGYLMVGEINYYNESDRKYHQDILLVKTDDAGSELWTKRIALENASFATSIEPVDDGFILSGIADYSVFILRINGQGDQQWVRFHDIGYLTLPYVMESTQDDGFILTGYTFEKDSYEMNVSLIKIAENGDLEWSSSFNYSSGVGYSVVQTLDQGFIVVGGTSIYDHFFYQQETVLIKTDHLGNKQWESTYSFGNRTIGNAVFIAGNGDIFVTGCVVNITGQNTTSSPFILKTDDEGNELWHQIIETTEEYSYMVSSAVAVENNCYVLSGYRYENDIFSGEMGAEIIDAFLLKLDENGVRQWNKTINIGSIEVVQRLCQTPDLGFILTGFTLDLTLLDVNAFLLKTDEQGNYQWNATFGWGWNDEIPPEVEIIQPVQGWYIRGNKTRDARFTLILGDIDIQVNVSDVHSRIDRVDFYIDDKLIGNDTGPFYELPYNFTWKKQRSYLRFFAHRHTLRVEAFDRAGNSAIDEQVVWRFF